MDLPSRLSFCAGNRHIQYISRLDGPFRCDVLAGMTSSGDEVVLSDHDRGRAYDVYRAARLGGNALRTNLAWASSRAADR